MAKALKIGVIGDFDKGRPSHVATTNALYHAATTLLTAVDICWLPTQPLEKTDNLKRLLTLDGVWGALGDPNSTLGVINAIQVVRETNIPYLGT